MQIGGEIAATGGGSLGLRKGMQNGEEIAATRGGSLGIRNVLQNGEESYTEASLALAAFEMTWRNFPDESASICLTRCNRTSGPGPICELICRHWKTVLPSWTVPIL